MTKLTVSQVAEMIGLSRQTVYRKLHDGTLSRNPDKTIELVEVLRVFPPSKYDYVTPDNFQNITQSNKNDSENDIYKNELISYLKAENQKLRNEKDEFWLMFKEERERTNTILANLPDLRENKKSILKKFLRMLKL